MVGRCPQVDPIPHNFNSDLHLHALLPDISQNCRPPLDYSGQFLFVGSSISFHSLYIEFQFFEIFPMDKILKSFLLKKIDILRQFFLLAKSESISA